MLPSLVSGILLKLGNKRRDEVEGGVKFGKVLQHGNHSIVVLHGMEPDPGHRINAFDQVLIEGLVHMPQEHETGLPLAHSQPELLSSAYGHATLAYAGCPAGLPENSPTDLTRAFSEGV